MSAEQILSDDSNCLSRMQIEPVTFRTIIKLFGVAVLVLLIAGYVLFQARYMIVGPQIILVEEPSTNLQNARVITLGGQTRNISRLWLNDRPIYTNANGYFEEALVLENGYTIATLRAEDRYGRITELSRSFVYTPMSFIQ